MPVSLDQFMQRLTDSEVLPPDEVRALLDSQPSGSEPRDGEQLARLLVKQNKLTAFQAQLIYSNKGAGLVLGNYLILDKLGQGGMGMVFKAQHRRMMRTVALKVLSPSVTKTKELVQRFQREVQAAARLSHPNIVAAFDADEARGTFFLVMEYVEGSDLASVVKKKGPLPVNDAVRCIVDAARGLEFAHKQGVIHRDIKPANLLLDTAGVVRILDMGLARMEGDAGAGQAELTSTGAVMGTIDYMAPEQALSTRNADSRSDVYSLGITLWYLLVGRAAYGGESLMARMLAHRENPIPSLRAARGDVPAALDAVFQKMVAKTPSDRFQSMADVVAALEGCLRGDSSAVSISTATSEDDRFQAFLAEMALAEAGLRPAARSKNATATVAAPTVTTDPTVALGGSDIQTDPQTFASLSGTNRRKSGAPIALPPWLADRRVQIGAAVAGGFLLLALMIAFWRNPRSVDPADVAPDGQSLKVKVPSSPSDSGKLDWSLDPAEAGNAPDGIAALEFDGRDDVVLIPTLEYDGPEITIEARVRLGAAADRGRLIVGGGTSKQYHSLWAYRSEAGFRVAQSLAEHRAQSEWTSPIDGRTITLAGVFDGTLARFFVDGKLVGTETRTPTSSPLAREPGYTIGAYWSSLTKSAGDPFDGVIDEVRISKSARYKSDYSPVTPLTADAQTLALYHCDEGAGNVLRDSSGNNHHGKIIGAKWVAPNGGTLRAAASSFGDWAKPVFGPWKSLLNGRDHTGWNGDGDVYVIENGVYAATGRGDLISVRDYADFEAELEFRLADKTSLGFGTSAAFSFRGAAENPRQLGLVVPLHTDQGVGAKKALQKRGALSGVIEPAADPYQPFPQWNTLRVLCLGRNITIEMNGVTLVKGNTADLLKLNPRHGGLPRSTGHLSLLTTKGHAEFRNLRVREATWGGASTPDSEGWTSLFNGADLSGWTPKGYDGWRVQNGALVGETTNQGNGWLMSEPRIRRL